MTEAARNCMAAKRAALRCLGNSRVADLICYCLHMSTEVAVPSSQAHERLVEFLTGQLRSSSGNGNPLVLFTHSSRLAPAGSSGPSRISHSFDAFAPSLADISRTYLSFFSIRALVDVDLRRSA